MGTCECDCLYPFHDASDCTGINTCNIEKPDYETEIYYCDVVNTSQFTVTFLAYFQTI